MFCHSQLLESSDGPVLRRRRRQLPDPASRPYIAAKLASLPATFTLGDEKRYNGVLNKPLPRHQQYLCFVLAALREQDGDTNDKYVRVPPRKSTNPHLGAHTQGNLVLYWLNGARSRRFSSST